MMFLRYWGSFFYDTLIITILCMVLTALILIITHGRAIDPATSWYQLILVSVILIYYYTSIKLGGQTIGMRAWRFKLTSSNQIRITKQQILLRILYFIPSILIAPLYLKLHYTLLNKWTDSHFISV